MRAFWTRFKEPSEAFTRKIKAVYETHKGFTNYIVHRYHENFPAMNDKILLTSENWQHCLNCYFYPILSSVGHMTASININKLKSAIKCAVQWSESDYFMRVVSWRALCPLTTHRSVLLDLLVVGDDLPDAVDEAALVVGDEAHEDLLLGRVEQHQDPHFTRRSCVGEMHTSCLYKYIQKNVFTHHLAPISGPIL